MTTICPSCGRAVADRAPCNECAVEARGSRMPKDNEIYQSMGWSQEPRASRMPPNVKAIDPTFYDVFNDFEPDEWALLEKGVKG